LKQLLGPLKTEEQALSMKELEQKYNRLISPKEGEAGSSSMSNRKNNNVFGSSTQRRA
jgi:hypothetical protein